MFSPLRFVIEPASFTLGSHIATFIAMFISLPVAIAVSLGTALGFFFGGFPPVIVLRAFSHVIFACVGALIISKMPDIILSIKKVIIFSLCIGLLHGVCEVIVVTGFYFGSEVLSASYYDSGFFMSVFLLVGVGTVVHSCVDFVLALGIWKVIPKGRNL
jgi:niacin transporter